MVYYVKCKPTKVEKYLKDTLFFKIVLSSCSSLHFWKFLLSSQYKRKGDPRWQDVWNWTFKPCSPFLLHWLLRENFQKCKEKEAHTGFYPGFFVWGGERKNVFRPFRGSGDMFPQKILKR